MAAHHAAAPAPGGPVDHHRTETIVEHEGADDSERSLLDSSAFIFRGERLTDVDPDELAVEVLKLRQRKKPE